MEVEIEAKWVDVSHTELRKKLTDIGANLVHPEVLMRRVVFNSIGNKLGEWARVRDEGDRITMSYKRVDDETTATGMSEVTLSIDDFDKGVKFLTEIGLERKAFQETKRELWKLGNAEITLDTWPWLPQLIEIEASSEMELSEIADKLGFSMSNAMYASADYVYTKYYDMDIDDINQGRDGWSEIVFTKQVPKWLEAKRRP